MYIFYQSIFVTGVQSTGGVNLPLGTLQGSELPGDGNGSVGGSGSIVSAGGDVFPTDNSESSTSDGDSDGGDAFGSESGNSNGGTVGSGSDGAAGGGSVGIAGSGSSGSTVSATVDESDKCAPLRKSELGW